MMWSQTKGLDTLSLRQYYSHWHKGISKKQRHLFVKSQRHQGKGASMVTAVILINVERKMLSGVMAKVLKIEGISEVHAVAGEYDLAAIARVKDNARLSGILAEKMCHQIPGIIHTKTLIALNSNYNYDAAAVYGKV